MAASSSLKTPALVTCQTLRNRLRNVNLADALPAQLVAKRSATGLFCYSEDDANTKKRTVGADRFRVEWETLTGGELLDRCTNQKSEYYYYTTTYDNDGADWWRGAVGDDVVDALPRKTSLWVGGNGSTTQAHYDVADNILGQCLGTKRIRCWAPSSHWAMTPFPDAHPLARKAQIDIEEMPAPDLDVTLEPGDALAIPAFWFHHCEARDLSASVNTFFPAAHAKRAALVFQTADPGGPLAEALAAFVDDAPAFARRVHATRYAPLEAWYAALRADDAAPSSEGGVAGPAGGARFYRNAADAKRPRAAPQKDFYRNQAARALDKLRAAGVADVVLAHLLELWGLRRCGDAARLGPLLLGDE